MKQLKKFILTLSILSFIFPTSITTATPSPFNFDSVNRPILNPDFFERNQIFYYDPSGYKCTPSNVTQTTGSELSVFGDNLLTPLTTKLKAKFSQGDLMNIDLKPNRTWQELIDTIREADYENKLKQNIIIALSDLKNPPTESNLIELKNAAGSKKYHIINYYSPTNPKTSQQNNQILQSTSDNYGKINLIDWAAAASAHSAQYFKLNSDQLTNDGQQALADLIYNSLNKNTASSTNSNLDYEGNPIFTPLQLAAIEKNKPIYQEVAKEFNFPWQILAVLHVRESSLSRTNPQNGQGIYQHYSPTERKNGTDHFKVDYTAGKALSEEEFKNHTRFTADAIRRNYSRGLNLYSDAGIKRMFFKYNGEAKLYKQQAQAADFDPVTEPYEGSPYVMNRADRKRDPKYNKNWQQYKSDGGNIGTANNIYGAFVMLKALGGGGLDCDNNHPYSANTLIAKTAIQLAWPLNARISYPVGSTQRQEPTPQYRNALIETGKDRLLSKGITPGASCDVFVTTVMAYSKVDPNFYCCGVTSQVNSYLKKQTDKYQEIPYTKQSDLQNGDILLHSGHIMIYVIIDEVGRLAHASYNGRSGEITGFNLDTTKQYTIFRYKGGF